MLTIFWAPRTRAGRAIWMAEELGLEYQLERVELGAAPGGAFAAASPMGKVPAIADGEVRMADSAAICTYLADRYGKGSLAPDIDDDRRGQYLYWMFFSPGAMEPAMAEKFGGWKPNPRAHGWGSLDAMLEVLSRGLAQGPWLLGEQFTAADVMVGSTANFMRMFGALEGDHPLINAYIDRCLARPAWQRAMAHEET